LHLPPCPTLHSSLLFFFIIPRPPRSPLFPYTTLFRSFSGASADNRVNYRLGTAVDKQNGVVPNSGYSRVNVTAASQAQIARWLRSEEHTSELQSRFDLVCRLLLEKKKKKKKQHPI